MEESILTSIKKLLGIAEDYDSFDTDIIIHINSVFTTLNQLGVGPSKRFRITDDSAVWKDFSTEEEFLDSVITYIYLKVKIVFDPPLNASVLQSYKEEIDKLEWRLNIDGDTNAEA